MIWSCPVCQKALHRLGKSVVCDSRHQFDCARQGYLPLLPVQHKRSATPGDDRNMLVARREFLNAGYYQPLADLLADKMLAFSDVRPGGVTCLDTGCGEGYYLNHLSETLAAAGGVFRGYGCDIAKEAVKLASASYKQFEFAVASNFKLPVLSSSVDVLLRVFAPGDVAEVARVLSPEGEFWRVVPGENHLQELKSHLYDHVTRHNLPDSPDGFEELEQQPLEFLISLSDSARIDQLLQMTPFIWQASADKLEALRSLGSLKVTAAFILQRYRVLR